MNHKTFLLAGALALTASGAHAIAIAGGTAPLVVSVTTAVVPQISTQWSNSLSVAQFDPSLGVLTAVDVELFGTVTGSAKGESSNALPTQVVLNLSSRLTLTETLTGTTLALVLPSVSNSFMASAYDGVRDFGGSSGRSFTGLSQQDSVSTAFVDPDLLGRFTGSGTVGLTLTAQGLSGYVSSANVATSFRTQAGGYAVVHYIYEARPGQFVSGVPEPHGWALMLAGMGVLGSLARRRSRR